MKRPITILDLCRQLGDAAAESPLGLDTPVIGWLRTGEDEVPAFVPATSVVVHDNEQHGGTVAFITIDHSA